MGEFSNTSYTYKLDYLCLKIVIIVEFYIDYKYVKIDCLRYSILYLLYFAKVMNLPVIKITFTSLDTFS